MLNPETNSLSPSLKSNGVRLVSAKHVTNHIKYTNGKKEIHPPIVINSEFKEIEFIEIIQKKIKEPIIVSYDTNWATDRKLPKLENKHAEDQPINKRG